MKTLIKWLQEHGIEFKQYKDNLNRIYRIVITLEKDCIWVNGFGEDMKYDKLIGIGKDLTYGGYKMGEVIGYNRSKTLFVGTKVKDLIKVLAKRLEVTE